MLVFVLFFSGDTMVWQQNNYKKLVDKMDLQVSRKSKFFCLVMALLTALGMFVSAGASVRI